LVAGGSIYLGWAGVLAFIAHKKGLTMTDKSVEPAVAEWTCHHLVLKKKIVGEQFFYQCGTCPQKFKADAWDGKVEVVAPQPHSEAELRSKFEAWWSGRHWETGVSLIRKNEYWEAYQAGADHLVRLTQGINEDGKVMDKDG